MYYLTKFKLGKSKTFTLYKLKFIHNMDKNKYKRDFCYNCYVEIKNKTPN